MKLQLASTHKKDVQQTTVITQGEAAVTQVDSNHRNYPYSSQRYLYTVSGILPINSGTLITGHNTVIAASGTLSAQRNQQIEGTQTPDHATAEREGTQPNSFTKQDCEQTPSN
jgi:hypothetical protein